MKGLLVKDLLMMRQHIFLTLVIILVYAFVAVTANGMAEVFSFITIFLGIFFPVNTLAYDDKAHWDRLALSMPVSRTTVILSKYLLSLGFMVVLSAVSLFFIWAIQKGAVTTEDFLGVAGVLALGVTLVSIMLPLMFKFGVEKARIIIFLVAILPVLASMLISKFDVSVEWSVLSDIKTAALCIGVAVIFLLAVSFLCSLSIYRRKEF